MVNDLEKLIAALQRHYAIPPPPEPSSTMKLSDLPKKIQSGKCMGPPLTGGVPAPSLPRPCQHQDLRRI